MKIGVSKESEDLARRRVLEALVKLTKKFEQRPEVYFDVFAILSSMEKRHSDSPEYGYLGYDLGKLLGHYVSRRLVLKPEVCQRSVNAAADIGENFKTVRRNIYRANLSKLEEIKDIIGDTK